VKPEIPNFRSIILPSLSMTQSGGAEMNGTRTESQLRTIAEDSAAGPKFYSMLKRGDETRALHGKHYLILGQRSFLLGNHEDLKWLN